MLIYFKKNEIIFISDIYIIKTIINEILEKHKPNLPA